MTTETENYRSPAIQAMVAYLMVPVQYAAIMAETVLSLNSQCPSTITRIDK